MLFINSVNDYCQLHGGSVGHYILMRTIKVICDSRHLYGLYGQVNSQ